MILKKSMGTAPTDLRESYYLLDSYGFNRYTPAPYWFKYHTYKPSHTILSSYTRVSYGFNRISSGNLFSASG